MEITQEYLDKKFENLLFEMGKKIGSLETGLETRLTAKMDSKIDALREEIKSFVIQGFEQHQTWVKEEFKEWIKPCEDRITKVEIDVASLKLNKKALA